VLTTDTRTLRDPQRELPHAQTKLRVYDYRGSVQARAGRNRGNAAEFICPRNRKPISIVFSRRPGAAIDEKKGGSGRHSIGRVVLT
jgi:hypothetical protein